MDMTRSTREVDSQDNSGGAKAGQPPGIKGWLAAIFMLLLLVLLVRIALLVDDLATGGNQIWVLLFSSEYSDVPPTVRYFPAFGLGSQLVEIAASAWLLSVFFRRKRYVIAAILITAAIDLFISAALWLYDANVLEMDLEHRGGTGVLVVAIIQYLGTNRHARETFTR